MQNTDDPYLVGTKDIKHDVLPVFKPVKTRTNEFTLPAERWVIRKHLKAFSKPL